MHEVSMTTEEFHGDGEKARTLRIETLREKERKKKVKTTTSGGCGCLHRHTRTLNGFSPLCTRKCTVMLDLRLVW